MEARVLVLVADGVEEIELVAPVDLLRRAGVEVVVSSLSGSVRVTTRGGLVIEADEVFSEEEISRFDGLLIPGGPGVAVLRKAGVAARVAADFFQQGKVVAAICAAPLLLQDAGLIDGISYTAHFSTKGELPLAEYERSVVVCGAIITSRGAGTAVEFGLALVERFCGAEVREKIARDIMFC